MISKSNAKDRIITGEIISRLIDKARTKFHLPSVAINLMSAKEIYLTEIRGTKVSGTNTSVTENDYFHIGSCSKSVLGLIAARLVEENRIKWNTPFFELFPELQVLANTAYVGITLEDLFLCEAGILPYTSDEEWSDLNSKMKSRYDFAQFLIGQPPSSPITSNGKYEHLYSNASYAMACLMLEKVSGKIYPDLIDKYLVKEMDLNTYIGFPNTLNGDQPWGHIIRGKSLKKFSPNHEYHVPYVIKPAGDLSMSPLTFGKYIHWHLKGLLGEDNFIFAKTYRYIHFGRQGFSIGMSNGKMAGHQFSGMDGSTGVFYCRAVLIPDSDFAFTIMTNAGSGTSIMKAVDWLTMKIVKKRYNWWWKFWI